MNDELFEEFIKSKESCTNSTKFEFNLKKEFKSEETKFKVKIDQMLQQIYMLKEQLKGESGEMKKEIQIIHEKEEMQRKKTKEEIRHRVYFYFSNRDEGLGASLPNDIQQILKQIDWNDKKRYLKSDF